MPAVHLATVTYARGYSSILELLSTQTTLMIDSVFFLALLIALCSASGDFEWLADYDDDDNEYCDGFIYLKYRITKTENFGVGDKLVVSLRHNKVDFNEDALASNPLIADLGEFTYGEGEGVDKVRRGVGGGRQLEKSARNPRRRRRRRQDAEVSH